MNHLPTVKWNSEFLDRILSMRFSAMTNSPTLKFEYAIGVLVDGELVDVAVPFVELPRRNYMGSMLDHARRDNVYLRGLGVFDRTVITVRMKGEGYAHKQSPRT